MKKIKFVKVVTPEMVSCLIHGDIKMFDYQCPNCDHVLASTDKYCSNCGAELKWTYINANREMFRNDMNTLSLRRK